MDTNKMRDISREQFEASAVIRHKDETWAVEAGLLRRGDDGCYLIQWLEIEWEVWQASREAVVVELPDHFRPSREEVIAAIQAQGLKVTP